VNARLNAVHLVKLIEVTEPMAVPDSPLPLLSVVFVAEDVHVSAVPVVVSFRVVVPDVALMTLPGLTVQEVAAAAGAALRRSPPLPPQRAEEKWLGECACDHSSLIQDRLKPWSLQ
jgi:hypothetical protein